MVRVALAVWLLSSIATIAAADPIEWTTASGGNGHFYDRVVGSSNWGQAKSAAESLSHLGIPGHLTTVGSQAELDFIQANLVHGSHWIGGFQVTTAPDYVEPAGGWRWVTGEPWAFTNWHAGEPTNENGNENFLEVHSAGVGTWNDLDSGDIRPAFYVEFGVDQIVPEPSGILLGASSFFAFSAFVWRRRRRAS